jgi:hypothetical protein
VRRDPALRADRLVKDWRRLEAQQDRLDGWRHRPARQRVEARMTAVAGKLKRDPELASLVRSRARELGLGQSSSLGRVMAAPSVRQAALEIGRDRDRGLGL